MTIKIDRNAGAAPRPLAEKLVAGQKYPFFVTLKHKNKKPLVVPSSGICTPIEPEVETTVKVKSLDQAWLLVTDLAELAHRADNSAADFAVLGAQVVAGESTAATKGGKSKPAEALEGV